MKKLLACAAAAALLGIGAPAPRLTRLANGADATPSLPAPLPNAAPGRAAEPAKKPNIVFILTDDLSTNLIQYMPNVLAMQKEGTTFANYFVTDSVWSSQ